MILPGSYYLVTRRCTQRQFLLTPSRLTNGIVSYAVAVAAEHTGVTLHAVCFMSNHWHAVVSDPEARLPEFLERAHRMIAKALNVTLDRCENFWSSDKPSVVLLVSPEDVLAKMAYVIANPTKAGLVRSPEEWPGVVTRRIGESVMVEMPDVFFDFDSRSLPDEAVLEFKRPAILEHLSDADLNRRLQELVLHLVRRARAALQKAGRPFVGVKGILRQSVLARPSSTESRNGPSPRVASGRASLRSLALRTLRAFYVAYREARESFRLGKRQRIFPGGTYALRVHFGVVCEPARACWHAASTRA